MSRFAAPLAVASATRRELVRRPGLLLATAAVAAFLTLLPGICARAVEEGPALALQAGVSTLLVFLSVVAGFAGLRATAADGDLGATSEWMTAPLTPTAYVAGRFTGLVATVAIIAALVLPFLVVADLLPLRENLPTAASLGITAFGVLGSAVQCAAVGMLLGAAASPQLAAVLFVVILVASRLLVPTWTSGHGLAAWLAAALPDGARLDFSRELAFGRPLDASSAGLACAAAVLQAAAYLALAAWALRRRES